MATNQLQQLLDNFESRLAVVEQSLSITPAGAAAGSRSAAAEQDAPYVMAYDSYCQLRLEPFVAASAKLGGGAAKGGDIVKRAWAAQRDFLVMASKCKKPAQQADLMAKLKPLQELVKAAGAIVSRDEWEMHAKTVNEGLGCLMWVAIAPPAGLPKDTVNSAVGGSDYWANKIRVQYKKTGPPEQVEFCDTFKALLVGLEEYVVEHHKAGLEWNARGGEVAAYTAGDAAAAPAAAAAPPKAPPLPAAPLPVAAPKPAAAGGAGLGAVFGELSKGLEITKGLKKVTKDQQTWRAEYKGSDASAAAPAAPKAPPAAAAAKPAANKPQGTPKLEFVQAGNKWVVEHQGKDAGVVTVEVTDTKHSVYVYGCVDATLDIKGKCKSVCIDGCRKSQVFVDECISSVEAVNCQRIKVQVRVAVPSVAIDKTDGFQCYLSATALETTFTTSKSSEMNVSFPRPGGDDDELMELPIPEQFVHSLTNLAPGGAAPMVTSSVSDLYTH